MCVHADVNGCADCIKAGDVDLIREGAEAAARLKIFLTSPDRDRYAVLQSRLEALADRLPDITQE